MPLIAALILQTMTPAPPAPARIDLEHVGPPILAAPTLGLDRRCDDGSKTDDILVCATRTDRYRLPIPTTRDDLTERVRGEAPTGLTAMTPAKPCGLFKGERSCSKREAAAYGYGNGRDPITFLGKVIGKIADPD